MIDLSFVNTIFEALLEFVPHRLVVKATHGGVAWKSSLFGSFPLVGQLFNDMRVVELRPGMHWYWPLTTEIMTVPVVRQTTNLSTQYLTTKCGTTVGISGMVIYEVTDVVKLLNETYDFESTIDDFGLSAIKDVVMSKTYEVLRKDDKLDLELARELRKSLGAFGIKVVKVKITDLAKTRVLALWGVNTGGDGAT